MISVRDDPFFFMTNSRTSARLALSVLFGLAAGNLAAAQDTRVLFLGNSYTAFNSLPTIVAELGAASGRTVIVDSHTPGGNTLGAPQGGAQHSTNSTSLAKIAIGNWDAVVLQDQSTLPSIPGALDAWSIPGAVSLAADIAAASPGARTIFFQTWGRRDGGSFSAAGTSVNFADFDAMQDALTLGYASLAAAAGGEVAPVGEAWRLERAGTTNLTLHRNDGSHPTDTGSYLAACVFHARLFGESPVGNSFTGGLDASTAAALQAIAAQVVLSGVESGACLPSANSGSAMGARIDLAGGTSLTAGTTAITAVGGVPNQFSILAAGDPSLPQPFGSGTLCIGAGLRRVMPPRVLDGAGGLQVPLDLAAPPFLGAGALQPGQRLAVQLVFRDPAATTGLPFNLSNELVLTIRP